MKKRLITTVTLLAVYATGAQADFDKNDASRMVQNFSEAVACQVESPFDGNSLQFKAIRIHDGFNNPGGLEEAFAVFWIGDYGCSGGNGTALPQLTLIKRSGFSSADPVIKTEFRTPSDMIMKRVDDFYPGEEENTFHIEGVKYGENDPQANPSQHVHYLIKANYDGFEVLDTL